jgi:hypothetical protein
MLQYARNLLVILAGFPLLALGQCFNGPTTYVNDVNYVTRENGNSAYAYAETNITGTDAPYWQLYISTSLYRDSSPLDSHSRDTAAVGQTAWRWYRRTLQNDGPGTYHMDGLSEAYNSYCDMWAPPFCLIYDYNWQCVSTWDGTSHSNNLAVVRPGRPDYLSGHPTALWYLGGITSDGSYSAQTVLTPGASNGAPEGPYYFVAYGTERLSLSCNGCNNPTATAISSSAGCQYFDVMVYASYNGFLSDPFYLFINQPWYTEHADDPDGGIWNWTTGLGNGWQSRINYTTWDLCSSELSRYSMNESFGSWSPDYAGTSWSPPSPNGWAVPQSQWFDTMSFQCPEGNCTPMPANPPPGCWPDCGSVKVQSAPQTFSVGTTGVGGGVAVQQDTHQRYQDHGSHD